MTHDRQASLPQQINPETADPATLVDRLRGIYRIPIRDGLGAVGAGEEPDNPDEFVRHHKTPPIQHAAANEIERLRAEVRGWEQWAKPLNDANEHLNSKIEEAWAREADLRAALGLNRYG